MPKCPCPAHKAHYATPWRCRWLGHKVRPVLTSDFWMALQHRCVRCGWSPVPAPQTARFEVPDA